MWNDEIVNETRAIREEYARRMNFDIKLIAKDMEARQKQHQSMMKPPDKQPLTDEQLSSVG